VPSRGTGSARCRDRACLVAREPSRSPAGVWEGPLAVKRGVHAAAAESLPTRVTCPAVPDLCSAVIASAACLGSLRTRNRSAEGGGHGSNDR
jgi:hypothetical protein